MRTASAMTWLTARSVSRAPPAFVFVPAPRDVAAVSAARAEAPALRAPPVRDVPVVCARDVDPVRVRAERSYPDAMPSSPASLRCAYVRSRRELRVLAWLRERPESRDSAQQPAEVPVRGRP
jgi:hypothetical protein